MQIVLPDDMKIDRLANAAGCASVEEYVVQLIERDAGVSERPIDDVERSTNEEWVREFRTFLKSLPSRNPQFDDSRESIYPHR